MTSPHLPLPQFLARLSRPALFASFYAPYSGVVFLAVAGLVFAPWAHRLLRRFHIEADER